MKHDLNKSFVYVYLDPRKPGKFIYDEIQFDFEPFYIGKGSSKKQLYRHLNEAKNETIKNSIKFYKIKHILNNNMEPIILKIKDNISEKEAYALEREIIFKIGRICIKTGPLSNLIEGGKGGVYNPPNKLRKLYSKHAKNKKYEEIYGEEKAKELKQKRIISNKERNIRKQIDTSKEHKEIKLTDEQKIKLNFQKFIKNPKTYKLTNPNNEFVIITNLTQACKIFKLHPGYTCALANGAIPYYKGWKCEIINNI